MQDGNDDDDDDDDDVGDARNQDAVLIMLGSLMRESGPARHRFVENAETMDGRP